MSKKRVPFKARFLSHCLVFLLGFQPLLSQTQDGSDILPVSLCYETQNQLDYHLRGLAGVNWSLTAGANAGNCPNQLTLQFLQRFTGQKRQFSPLDRNQTVSLGVDPATLTPQGLDLDFFPSVPVSEAMSLKPSLAYSPDSILSRRGDLTFGAPKTWKNNYGELVRVIARQWKRKWPLGQTDPALNLNPGSASGPLEEARQAVPVKVQTYFVNAAGQEVNFYPDPDQFSGGPGPYEPPDPLTLWYSEEGNYRLARIDGSQDYFELRTPNGLVFTFEPYRTWVDAEHESLSLHYRTATIEDVYGNRIDVHYDDVSEPTLRPTTVTAYRADGSFVNQLKYTYDGMGRLATIRVPRYRDSDATPLSTDIDNDANVNIFSFSYSEKKKGLAQLHAVGGGGTTYQASGSTFALTPFAVRNNVTMDAPSGTDPRLLTLSGWDLTDIQDAEGRPLLLHGALDFSQGPDFPAKSYIFEIVDSGTSYFFTGGGGAEYQAGQNQGVVSAEIHYGRQWDLSTDTLYLNRIGNTGNPPAGTRPVTVKIYPMIKNGDKLARTNMNGFCSAIQIPNWDGDLADVTFDPAAIPLSGSLSGTVYHLREDNLARIAEITFPPADGSATGMRKRIEIQYDETSLNHQEIRAVRIFDRGFDNDQTPILETRYEYRRLRTLTVPNDFDGTMVNLVPDQNQPIDWLPCLLDDPNMQYGIETQAGIALMHEQELDVLRRKTVRIANPMDGEIDELVTHYGGAYRFALAGNDVGQADSGETLGCDHVQWGLDGKPFEFTWEIGPDDRGMIYDLNPDGLNLDPLLAQLNRRKRVFKTYHFDAGFGSAFRNQFAAIDDPDIPYLDFLPLYRVNGDAQPTLADLSAQPDLPAGFAVPGLEQLFAMSQTLCYAADITVFELVPPFKYNLASDISNAGDFPIPETLKVLHGLVNFEAPLTRDHLRTSPIKLHGLQGDWTDADWDAFIVGLKESPSVGVPGGTVTQRVPWSSGGYLNTRFQSFFDREKIGRLRPHFTYRLKNLEGFDWVAADAGSGIPAHLDFNPQKHFLQGTRLSNGGYLGSAVPGSGAKGENQLQISGATSGLALLAGDIFYHRNLIYRIESHNGNQIQFTPPLRFDTDPAAERLTFFRYFDAARQNGYRGYDSFDNQAYRESYVTNKNAPGMDWTFDFGAETFTGPNVYSPRFPQGFADLDADTLSINDSTDPANNDDQGLWRYFGRITRQFESHSLSFDDYSQVDQTGSGTASTLSGIQTGLLTELDYSQSPFEWKPWRQRRYYRPVQLTDFSLPAPPAVHDQDGIVETAYFGPNDPNDLARGRIRAAKNYRHGDGNTFSATVDAYTDLGFPETRDTASFRDGLAPYARRVQTQYDGNTGLPRAETVSVADAAATTEAFNLTGTLLTQSGTNWTYDRLGREIRSIGTDANGNTFGPVSHTFYTTPFETRTLTTIGTDPDGERLTEAIAFIDGRERPVLHFSRFGVDSQFDAEGQTYDIAGRLERSYSLKRVASPTPQPVLSLFAIPSAYTQTVYNQRGEAVGRVEVLDGVPFAASWNYETQAGNSAMPVHYSFSHEPAPIDRVNIKKTHYDGFGNMVEVRDFERAVSGPLIDDIASAQSFIAGFIDNPSTALTEAEYAFDRFGNIVRSEVGTGAPQVRSFAFDQRNRLRRETHPEMNGGATPVDYADFDLFDNPETVTQGSRTVAYGFDGAGNLKQIDAGTAQTSYLYKYELTPGDPMAAPNRPASPHLVKHLDSGFASAYLYDWEPGSGLLLSRELLHDRTAFPQGYSQDLSATTPTSNSPLRLKYAYDLDTDNLGRMITKTFPSPVWGHGAATKLRYHFDSSTGLLERIEDETLANMDVVTDILYGVGGSVDGFRIHDHAHGVTRTRDSLNRLETLRLTAADQDQTRAYGYDALGRIDAVTWGAGRGYRYGYDSLGQIRTGSLTHDDGMGGTQTHQQDYQYDAKGLGNLVSLNGQAIPVDLNTNQLFDAANPSHYQYSPFGELTQGRRGAETYTMAYSSLGRPNQYTSSGSEPEQFLYHYDPFGMRILVDDLQNDRQTLYVYDENNMVQSELVAAPGRPVLWDRHYLYFDGKTVLSYEAESENGSGEQGWTDGGSAGPVLMSAPLFTWDELQPAAGYDFQLANEFGAPIRSLDGVFGTQVRLSGLAYGSYRFRVRASNGLWQPWQPFIFTSEFHKHLAGDYPMEGNGSDRSFYQNHASVLGAVPITDDWAGGFLFDGNDEIRITDPHRFQEPGQRGTVMLWIDPDGGISMNQQPDRALFHLGGLVFLVGKTGSAAVWDGTATNLPSSLQIETWQHLALVYGQGNIECYLNGQSVLSLTGTSPVYPSADFVMGIHPTWDGYEGGLDDLQIHNRALTPAEIGAHYQSTLPLKLENPE